MGVYWTIQTVEAWAEAQKKGYLKGDGRRIIPELRPAYHWMMVQMKKRLPHYRGDFPLWLWVHKPDLRQVGHLSPGSSGVRLKLEIPDARVLLSDFQKWHIVLNEITSCNNLNNFSNNSSKMTWNDIFYVDHLRHFSHDPSAPIQGVTERIYMDEIRTVTGFVAR